MRILFLAIILSQTGLLAGQNIIKDNTSSRSFLKVAHYQSALLLAPPLDYPGQAPIESLIDLKGYGDYSSIEETYRDSPEQAVAYGKYLMARRKYRSAQTVLFDLPGEAFTTEEYEEIRFLYAFCLLESGDKEFANAAFKEVTYYNGEYFYDANYFLGVASYQEGDKSAALDYFRTADQSPKLTQYTTPFIAESYLSVKDYKGLIAFIKAREGALDYMSYVYLGEAYFGIKDYRNAVYNYEEVLKLGKELSIVSQYKLGFSYDKLNAVDKAIDQYKEVGRQSGEIGQLAAYRLGELYFQKQNYTFSSNAFSKAHHITLNSEISRMALYQKSKVLLAAGQLDEAISAINDYLNEFPNRKEVKELNRLLAEAYANSSDYRKAIASLEASGLEDRSIHRIYQQVTFKAAVEEYNNENLLASSNFLEKALRFPIDRNLAGKSYFLLGEVYSAQGDFQKAVENYRKANSLVAPDAPESDDLKYGLGYAYFNQKQYGRAKTYFEALIRQSKNKELVMDATLRVADCEYINKNYDQAINLYKKAINSSGGDYACFQLGTCYYLNDNPTQSEDYFKKVLSDYASSIYRDNAGFQLGKLYFENEKFEAAVKSYTYFIGTFPNSQLLPYALLERGLSYSNLNQLEKAFIDFRRIIDEFTSHETVENALLGMQSLQQKAYVIDNFDQYLSKVEQNVENKGSLSSIALEQAKTEYFNQQYDRAIKRLKSILDKKPDAEIRKEVTYYLADSYYRMEDWNNAIINFGLIKVPGDYYYSRVMDKLGSSYQNNGDLNKALSVYRELYNNPGNQRDIYNALEGMVVTYYHQGKYDSVFSYTAKIRNASWKPATAAYLCNLYDARSYYNLKKYTQASDLLIELINSANSMYASEALYMLAKIESDKGNFLQSNETLIDLVSNYSNSPPWSDEAYFLLVENYIELGELLQAEATLNSIIDRTNKTELRNRAQKRLQEISTNTQTIEEDTIK